MVARNALLNAPPFQVEQALKTLGANLRTARLRRNMSIQYVVDKIGVGRHVVSATEKGKPSTGVAVYAAILWALGLVEQLADVASPDKDEEGKTLALARDRRRARPSEGLDDEF